MQLYLFLRAHFTPARLHAMGILDSPVCGKCLKDHGDLIHLTWRCPKLRLYWVGVLNTINSVFQTSIPLNTKPCLLGIFDDFPLMAPTREVVARALFQAWRVILRHWKSTDSSSNKEWIQCMGESLRLEKYIFQHRGHPHKFDNLWSPWLDTPGLSPLELVIDRLLVGQQWRPA